MRPVVCILVATFVASILVNILSGLYITDLRDKVTQLQDELLLRINKEAAADAAYSTYDKTREAASQKAKERRDALQTITPNSTDADILRACRDGLCQTGKTHSSDTTGSPDATMRTP